MFIAPLGRNFKGAGRKVRSFLVKRRSAIQGVSINREKRDYKCHKLMKSKVIWHKAESLLIVCIRQVAAANCYCIFWLGV